MKASGGVPALPTTSPNEGGGGDEQRRTIVVACIDNNSWEVGMAFMDMALPIRLNLSQIVDNRSFTVTLQQLDDLDPREILMPESHAKRALVQILTDRFPHKVTLVTRSLFNETTGEDMIQEFASDPAPSRLIMQGRYLARASTAALLTFAERERGNVKFAHKSLKVEVDTWSESSGRLAMDAFTVRALELIQNTRDGKREGSLLSILDHTKTKMGARLLRAQIISPPSTLTTITSRLTAVAEGVANMDVVNRIRSLLKLMPDTDQLVSRFTSVASPTCTVRELRVRIESLTAFQACVAELQTLDDALSTFESDLWVATESSIGTERLVLGRVADLIHDRLVVDQSHTAITDNRVVDDDDDDIRELEQQDNDHVARNTFRGRNKKNKRMRNEYGKPHGNDNRHVKDLFVIRASQDGLLDAARVAYINVIQAMSDLVERYQDIVPESLLKFSASRGYHLVMPRKYESRLPVEFVQAVVNKYDILCTSKELANLNSRQANIEQEILKLTVVQLDGLHDAVVSTLPSLLKVSESLALIDMILSFAVVAEERHYCRPEIEQCVTSLHEDKLTGLSIVRGRHPVVETFTAEFVANDAILNTGQRLCIVSGPNAGGKSTWLSQIALIAIMTHMGCFVPADSVRMPLMGRICTRLRTNDALDQNASTFSLEMSEAAYMIDSVTAAPNDKGCLCLLDELGRGTSSADGLAMAWAVAEDLMVMPSSRTFFSTHFSKLRLLAELKPSRATSVHFVSGEVDDLGGSAQYRQTHRLVSDLESPMTQEDRDGFSSDDDYGIRLAKACGMFEEVVMNAKEFRSTLVKEARRNVNMVVKGTNTEVESSSSSNQLLELFKVLCAIERKVRSGQTNQGTVVYDVAEARKYLGELKELV